MHQEIGTLQIFSNFSLFKKIFNDDLFSFDSQLTSFVMLRTTLVPILIHKTYGYYKYFSISCVLSTKFAPNLQILHQFSWTLKLVCRGHKYQMAITHKIYSLRGSFPKLTNSLSHKMYACLIKNEKKNILDRLHKVYKFIGGSFGLRAVSSTSSSSSM